MGKAQGIRSKDERAQFRHRPAQRFGVRHPRRAATGTAIPAVPVLRFRGPECAATDARIGIAAHGIDRPFRGWKPSSTDRKALHAHPRAQRRI
ncbi:hypothetical protein [Agromyces seonyuensis]|uniref:hypothetical protein n=1 Tax=Agromyces seonyuensis TaxID=2662446 RepID=UPI0013666AAE|nr:hypothetical protein [Agromyces seonyuensis]